MNRIQVVSARFLSLFKFLIVFLPAVAPLIQMAIHEC